MCCLTCICLKKSHLTCRQTVIRCIAYNFKHFPSSRTFRMAYSDVILNSNGDKPYKSADAILNINNVYGIHEMLRKQLAGIQRCS